MEMIALTKQLLYIQLRELNYFQSFNQNNSTYIKLQAYLNPFQKFKTGFLIQEILKNHSNSFAF